MDSVEKAPINVLKSNNALSPSAANCQVLRSDLVVKNDSALTINP
jgi:hypothetical protein